MTEMMKMSLPRAIGLGGAVGLALAVAFLGGIVIERSRSQDKPLR